MWNYLESRNLLQRAIRYKYLSRRVSRGGGGSSRSLRFNKSKLCFLKKIVQTTHIFSIKRPTSFSFRTSPTLDIPGHGLVTVHGVVHVHVYRICNIIILLHLIWIHMSRYWYHGIITNTISTKIIFLLYISALLLYHHSSLSDDILSSVTTMIPYHWWLHQYVFNRRLLLYSIVIIYYIDIVHNYSVC